MFIFIYAYVYSMTNVERDIRNEQAKSEICYIRNEEAKSEICRRTIHKKRCTKHDEICDKQRNVRKHSFTHGHSACANESTVPPVSLTAACDLVYFTTLTAYSLEQHSSIFTNGSVKLAIQFVFVLCSGKCAANEKYESMIIIAIMAVLLEKYLLLRSPNLISAFAQQKLLRLAVTTIFISYHYYA